MVNLFLTQLRQQDRNKTSLAYLDSLIVPVGEVYLVSEVQRMGAQNGVPDSFNMLWRIEKTGFLRFDLVNDHDAAKYVEYGFRGDYTIEGNPDLHFQLDDGDWIVTPMVQHPGFPGYHIFDKTVAAGALERFQDQLAKETTSYLQRTKMS